MTNREGDIGMCQNTLGSTVCVHSCISQLMMPLLGNVGVCEVSAWTVSINYRINMVTCLSAGKDLRTNSIGVLQRNFFFALLCFIRSLQSQKLFGLIL